jgi:hypothetical protein
MTAVQTHSGARDFDFLIGSWQVANQRLRSRLTDSDEWEQFEATWDYEPVLGGLGNVGRYRAAWSGMDFEGCSLRLFNPATGQWSIYWADNVSCTLLPPLVGKFEAGAGEFFGDDQHDGRPVRVRFRWLDITPDAARWEQAFSEDRGETWETNWIMTFTRRQAAKRVEAIS